MVKNSVYFMKSGLFKAVLFGFIILLCINCAEGQEKSITALDLNGLSEEFLQRIKLGKDTKDIQNMLANTTLNQLENGLHTDAHKLSFWVNIYNAYIQVILSKNPELYENRNEFFNKAQIEIAGETISFAKIEHGIIRKSQWDLGLGYFRKWFPNKFERKLRVENQDYRVHFALNCGAKDCPPVTIYKAQSLNEQFNKGMASYLTKTSEYDKTKKEVAVTSLFSWFRGDFGSKSGVKKILKEVEIIPTTKEIDLIYKDYDWTLDLNNFIDL